MTRSSARSTISCAVAIGGGGGCRPLRYSRFHRHEEKITSASRTSWPALRCTRHRQSAAQSIDCRSAMTDNSDARSLRLQFLFIYSRSRRIYECPSRAPLCTFCCSPLCDETDGQLLFIYSTVALVPRVYNGCLASYNVAAFFFYSRTT